MSKWSHLMLWPVVLTWSAQAAFSSPEAALLLVSTKNLDLWLSPTFWACAENSFHTQPIRFVRLDYEHAQSKEKSMNQGLLVSDLTRGRDSRCWPKRARHMGKRMQHGKRLTMFRKDVERFHCPVMKTSLRFPNGKIITVPLTSFIKDFE